MKAAGVGLSAAVEGGYGLAALIDDTSAIYGVDTSPANETHYRARFYLDPNGIDLVDWDRFILLLDSNWSFNVNLAYGNGEYMIAAECYDDGSNGYETEDYEISDAWHAVEIEWAAASSPGADDGYLTFWIDGVLKETLSGLDTDEERISEVQLGVPADLDSGDSGTFYIDAFESRRTDYIGLLAYEGSHYKLAAPAGRRAAQEESTSTPTPTPTETPTPTSTGTETPVVTETPTPTETVTPTPTVSPASPLMLMGAGTPTEPPPAALASAQYIYDGDNNLVKAVVNGAVTFYPGRHYNLEVDGSTTTVKKFYAVGGLTIAVRTVVGEQDTLHWILSDHLGSLNVTANEDGSWNSEIRYSAFGEVRWKDGLTPTEYRFTGQLEQAELGLYFYVARFYDAELAHFISADTIVPDPYNVPDWNRYSYGLSNPVKYNDPTGHDVGCGGKNADCSPYSNITDSDRQDYLFSLIFLGSGEGGAWTRDDWVYYNSNRNQLWDNPSKWKNPDPETGAKGFVLHTERLASHYEDAEKGKFVEDFSLVFGGISRENPWPIAAYEARHGPKNLRFLNEKNEGLAPEYIDTLSPFDNQSHHYVGIFFLSYHVDPELAAIVNLIRDPDNPGDIILGNRAATDAYTFRYYSGGPSDLPNMLSRLLDDGQ